MKTYSQKTSESPDQSSVNTSESMQGKAAIHMADIRQETLQLQKQQEMITNSNQTMQLKTYQAMADRYTSGIIQLQKNDTGLPDTLKSGIEHLSGYSLNDVKVHYNSSRPAQLQAHAYAQGTDIHIASGQEKHLAHEAWHVVQQKQGRVKATKQLKSNININDDHQLEHEADVMGMQASSLQLKAEQVSTSKQASIYDNTKTIQAVTRIEHTTSSMQYDDFKPEEVGIAMNASLDPLDPVRGSATDPDNTPMYRSLWASHRMVRGHLLNHDLGGYGVPENLFPITSGANSDHSIEVEANVKDALADANKAQRAFGDNDRGIRVNYNVRVKYPNEIANNAFQCEWQLINPVNGDGALKRKEIPSLSTENRNWHGAGSGRKSAAWAHGDRKGDRNADRAANAHIAKSRLTSPEGVAHSSVVGRLAVTQEYTDADPHKFVDLMIEYEKLTKKALDKGAFMDWFHARMESDGGLDEINEQINEWESELDEVMRNV